MRVAESFKNYEYDETKAFEKNGKLYVSAKCKCDRCTKGVYVTRVENGQPVPHPAYGGVCLKCGGVGYVRREIRLYTDKEFEAIERAAGRRANKVQEEREAKQLANAENKKSEWLSKNGFNQEGKTYVYFLDDSFDKKGELKDVGFRFQKELLWHIGEMPKGYEDKCIEINITDVAEIAAWGEGLFRPDARKIVDAAIKAKRPVVERADEWYGEVGKRFYNLPATLVAVREVSTKFGETQLVKFVDTSNHEFNWWTTVEIKHEVGAKILLTATVKKFDEYEGTKITVINRAKLEAV